VSPLTTFGFAAMIGCTVAANLLLKTGAMQPGASRVIFGILGWQSAAGLAMFGVGGLMYAVLLRRVPLNLAQVFTATQFIGVVLAARVILQEPISPLRWIGIAVTCAGVAIVGATAGD
jgi:drug/metabolite transporter (DMT)-like permease